MKTKMWLLCGGLVAGLGTTLALRGQSQEMGGFNRPGAGPGVGAQESFEPSERQDAPGPMMRGGPGGPGMRSEKVVTILQKTTDLSVKPSSGGTITR